MSTFFCRRHLQTNRYYLDVNCTKRTVVAKPKTPKTKTEDRYPRPPYFIIFDQGLTALAFVYARTKTGVFLLFFFFFSFSVG